MIWMIVWSFLSRNTNILTHRRIFCYVYVTMRAEKLKNRCRQIRKKKKPKGTSFVFRLKMENLFKKKNQLCPFEYFKCSVVTLQEWKVLGFAFTVTLNLKLMPGKFWVKLISGSRIKLSWWVPVLSWLPLAWQGRVLVCSFIYYMLAIAFIRK